VLVLARSVGESIVIGHDVKVTVLEVVGGVVRLGIVAPPNVSIHREEVYLEIEKANVEAAKTQ
jgi:carbon storage regulator